MEIIVSSKGQIVIPFHLREKYDLKQGTKLKVSDEEGLIKLIPPVKVASLCGSWELDKKTIEKEIKEGRKDWR
jgi:AbrB family looped-hinge helix DNA binding protein